MLDRARHVHIVGIGGIGTSALATLSLHWGKTVSGSDIHDSPIVHDLVRRGAKIAIGHAAGTVPEGVDLLVYSAAVPDTDTERETAAVRGIPQRSYFDALGELSKRYTTIAISGTHGKSTTTALIGLMLEAAGYDPLVIVGSFVPGFKDGNLRAGGGRFFVVEACEYKAHMLKLFPEMIVLTNIEEDHLDFYRDITHIRETFQTFVDGLKGQGVVITNANDPVSQQLKADRAIRFGFETEAQYVGSDRRTASGIQSVSVRREQPVEALGDLTLHVPGAFNVMNALAATAAAMELGVPFETCKRVLKDFRGIWRRFERVGEWKGAEVISDYGHHPTAILATVEAAHEFFPKRRVVLCFQPHQHSRTKELLKEFVQALRSADVVIIPEIYKVVGRTEAEEKEVSSRDLVERVHALEPAKTIRYAQDLNQAQTILAEVVRAGDVIIVQGAGDVDDVARALTT